MTAREKFIARLKELGLLEEWEKTGEKVGKVLSDKTIVLLVHYEWESGDPYTEIHYPPFEELRKHESFLEECRNNFYENNDDKFVADLARWIQYGEECHYHCPLFPEDLYFAANGLETSWQNFEDDPDTADTAKQAIQAIADKFGLNVSFE